jgi:hypothetical protein
MVCCNEEDCNKIAVYGYEYKKALKCNIHRVKPNMKDVTTKRCEKCLISVNPCFGLPDDDKSPSFCAKCKTQEMIDKKNKKCKCGKAQPSFGYKDDERATCCQKCALPNMIDIKNNKCVVCNLTQPIYGYENDERATHCMKCMINGMINIRDKMCIECNKVHPSYGYENDKSATHCFECHLPDMINIKSIRCKCGISTKKTFGYPGEKTICCSKCQELGMIDLVHKRCQTINCNTQISNTYYEGYCLRCFIYLFPDKPVVCNYKTKEAGVAEFIKEHFSNYNLIFDKKIDGGSSLRRPDILINLENQVVIIEIDENQHKKYDCGCDNRRLMELSLDVNHKSMVFIRFNPDEYIDKNNKNIKSCWTRSKEKGLLLVKEKDKDKWNERLNNLKDAVEYWINNTTDKTIEIIQMYYDQNL